MKESPIQFLTATPHCDALFESTAVLVQDGTIYFDAKPRSRGNIHPTIDQLNGRGGQLLAEGVRRSVVFKKWLLRKQRMMSHRKCCNQLKRCRLRNRRTPNMRIDLNTV
jgi:hypothetical protein